MKAPTIENSHKANVDTASLVGLWVGVLGLVLGVISLGVSLYVTYAAERRVFYLVLSGWLAACLCIGLATFLGYHLIRRMAELAHRCIEVSSAHAILEKENDRLVAISDYVVSKAVRTAKPRVASSSSSSSVSEGDTPEKKQE